MEAMNNNKWWRERKLFAGSGTCVVWTSRAKSKSRGIRTSHVTPASVLGLGIGGELVMVGDGELVMV